MKINFNWFSNRKTNGKFLFLGVCDVWLILHQVGEVRSGTTPDLTRITSKDEWSCCR